MPLPIPNLDDKTFNEFFEEARASIPRYAPEWTDHNLSDPGITFIDLFAWLAEMQIYFLNRVTDKNFTKFLKLLGEAPVAAKSARADVTFELKTDAPVTIPKATQVAATDPVSAERIVFETDEDVLVHSSTLRQVLTYASDRWIDNTEANKTIGVSYFTFGDEPRQGDKLYLGFNAKGAFPEAEIKLILNIFDSDLSEKDESKNADGRPELIPSAELEWDYSISGNRWRQLQVNQVDDDTVALTRNGSLRLKDLQGIASAKIEDLEKGVRSVSSVSSDAMYWVRVSVKTPGYEIPPRLDTIVVNTVSATNGKTISHEYSSSNGLPLLKIKLRHKPVLHRTVELIILEEMLDKGEVLKEEEMLDKEKILEKDKRWHEWKEVDDFDASGPEDRHFIVNLLDGLIKFGDGIQGRIPPAIETNIGNIHVIKYRVGGGEKGNVKSNMIQEILDNGFKDKVKLTNPRPAAGGSEHETLTEAKSRARRILKEISRGITTTDFETLTLNAPGIRVARVKALTGYHPKFPAIQMPGAVTVVVVPEIFPANTERLPDPSDGFLQNVKNHLISKSVVSTNLSVIRPEFIEVTVTAKIRVDPWMDADDVRQKALDALSKFLNPLTGGHDGAGWPFGRTVYKSEIYQIIEGIAGVVCVDQVLLAGKSCDTRQRDRITLRKIGLVYSGKHQIAIS